MNAKPAKGWRIVALPLFWLLMGNAPNPLDVGCSQAALDARDNYGSAQKPTVLEFVGKRGQRLGDAVVTLSRADGGDPITISCGAPRLLMRLSPGRYMAVVDMAGGMK